MQQWEYYILTRERVQGGFIWGDAQFKDQGAVEVLNALGQQGWELVAMPNWKWGGNTDVSIQYVFKRPRG